MSQEPHDQLLLQIRGAVAEYERSIIAERLRRGRLARYKAGTLLPWTRVPFGYRVDPDHPRDPKGIRLEEVEATQISEMFNHYLQASWSLWHLAKDLNQLGIATPMGHAHWYKASVKAILTNPVYAGKVYAGRVRRRPVAGRQSALAPVGKRGTTATLNDPAEWILAAQIPAIVSQEIFDGVQAKLAKNKADAKRNNTSHQYLLRVMMSCGKCGLAYYARSNAQNSYRKRSGVVKKARLL